MVHDHLVKKYEQYIFNKTCLQKNIIHKKILSTKKNIDKKNIYIKKFKQYVMTKNFGKTIFRKTRDKHFCREMQFRYGVPNQLSTK